MEVLNAAGVTPLTSLHKPNSDKRQDPPTRRPLLPLKPTKPSPTKRTRKPNLAAFLSRSLHAGGGLAALSSALRVSPAARALTYEQALQQSMDSSSSFDGSTGFDVGGLLDGFVRFGSENPLVVGGGALALAVPLILSQILGGMPRNCGVQSAKVAYASLSEDGGAQLVDIRERKEFKVSGSPNLRSLKKKAASIAYDRKDKQGFLKKLSLRFRDPGNTTLYILDKFDSNSELVAQLVTANGFKAAYAVKDGADGRRGWKNSGLPWTDPRKAVSLDFGDFKNAIGEVFSEGKDGFPVTLGLAAATGLGALVFSEIETVLQLLGSAAIVQFGTKKLLFAEDRKVTLRQIDEFLNTKIAPNDVFDEIKMIGKALLPVSMSTKTSLPAPADTSSIDPPSVVTGTKVEAMTEPPKEISPAPQEEKLASHSTKSRPLSPYANYPDFKPPSSPCPSQP